MTSPFARITQTYDRLVSERGDVPEACDYGSAESQRTKFHVLSSLCDLSGLHVLDVGCGLAHYADYLERRYDDIRYTGIDLSSAMIELAGRRRSDLDLRVANLLDIQDGLSYDVVNANGIFYLLGDEAPDLVPRLVERMWSLARVAMAFNSLSAWAPSRDPNEYQAHPLETAEMCRQFSPRIVLRHDYMPHDFTIYVYRGGHG